MRERRLLLEEGRGEGLSPKGQCLSLSGTCSLHYKSSVLVLETVMDGGACEGPLRLCSSRLKLIVWLCHR